jgi:membrane fusion protein, multidrug efflux system
MLKRRPFWIVLVLLLLAAGVAAAMLKKKETVPNASASASASPTAAAQQPQAMEFLPSDITTAQQRDLRQQLPLTGALRAVNQASVKARVGGEVRDVLVREGEAVKAGQVVVRMDAGDYQARVEQARGALLAARGQLDIAVKARDNNKALLEKGFISKNAVDNATSQFEIARANVESAQAALDVAQKALSDTVIKTPISGLVSSRTVQPGEKVSPDNRLLDVVDLGGMELEAAVPAAEIMRVALGQEVQVRLEGLPTPLAGKVARINPATQAGSRSVMVYVQIDNPQGMLRVGMFGQALLTLSRKSGVLVVPQSAIQSDGVSPFVYAIENGKIARKPVELGIRGDDGQGAAVEIVKGLENGTQVVRTNLGILRPGTTVKLSQAPAPASASASASASPPAPAP